MSEEEIKKEPLTRKQSYGECKDNNSWGYSKKQVKSAVEWLKEKTQKDLPLDQEIWTPNGIIELIDEAFEDVK